MEPEYDPEMSIVDIARHLIVAEPEFECESLARPGIYFRASARHQLRSGASHRELAHLRSFVCDPTDELVDFYSLIDGGEFFRDNKSDHSLMWLYPLNEWSHHTAELKQIYAEMGHKSYPKWFTNGVAIGEVSHSLNGFVVDLSGNGEIYLTDHEGSQPELPIADSLGHLLLNMAFDTIEFARVVGAYPRLTDPVTGDLGCPVRIV
ncbi:MAG: hypothetical protein U0795_06740 [Pirellulales bacterium]